MIRTLKLTDISKSEIERTLNSVRFSGTLCCEILENDLDISLKCNVEESNKMVFAEVFRELEPFIYTDEDETPFTRLASLADVRKLKIGVIDQGFRGKLTEQLFSNKCNVNCSVGFEEIEDLENYFDSKDYTEIAKQFARGFGLDVVIFGCAEFEQTGIISSFCKVVVYSALRGSFENSYYFLGTNDDISTKLSFVATAFAAKKIY